MTTAAVDEMLVRICGVTLGHELGEFELPEARVVGAGPARRPTRKAMLGGRFYVYGQAEDLRSPIDWQADPHGAAAGATSCTRSPG